MRRRQYTTRSPILAKVRTNKFESHVFPSISPESARCMVISAQMAAGYANAPNVPATRSRAFSTIISRTPCTDRGCMLSGRSMQMSRLVTSDARSSRHSNWSRKQYAESTFDVSSDTVTECGGRWVHSGRQECPPTADLNRS